MASALHNGVSNAFQSSSDGLRQQLHEVKGSQYYVTHNLGKQMNEVENGVNHMRLDSDLLHTSREWGGQFDRNALSQEKADSSRNMAAGQAFIGQYKSNFDVPKVQRLQENQVKEMHEWAERNLGDIKKELHPYASSAQGRINKFCDYIGVTDRYTGYRNNLNRGNRDPTQLGMSWLRGAEKNPYQVEIHQGYKPSGEVYLPASLPKRKVNHDASRVTVESLNPIHSNGLRVPSQPRTLCIQERCGINTTFPGITEYMKRYNRKQLPEEVTAFTINPTPNFSIYGRPMAKVEWSADNTEYQTRYEWPECSKIVKKPWLRK